MSAKAQAANPSATLDAILAQLGSQLSPARAADAQRFARLFFRRMPQDDIEARSVAGWSALLAGLLDFMRVRAPDTAAVRVFNPTADEHGWDASHSVVQIVTDDSPFLVDSVSMAIASVGGLVHSVIHPVLAVERDQGGHVLAMADDLAAPGRGKPESIMHFEVDRRAEPAELEKLRQAVEIALADVKAAVRDWRAMRDRALAIAEDAPDFVEATVYSREDAVIMTGNFDYGDGQDGGAEATPTGNRGAEATPINRLGLPWKPWFYKHVEGYLWRDDAVQELVPLKDYLMRHNADPKPFVWTKPADTSLPANAVPSITSRSTPVTLIST